MLNKVYSNNANKELLTSNLYNFMNQCDFNDFIAQDNGKFVVIKKENEYFAYTNHLIKLKEELKVMIEFDGKYFWKSITSFGQNNVLIANDIRKITKYYLNDSTSTTLIGIGGEYHIYFATLKYENYIGFTNYLSRYQDSLMNCRIHNIQAENYLVNFNRLNIPNNHQNIDIILNVVSITDDIMKEIGKLDVNRLVVISCKPLHRKVKFLSKYFKFKHIEYFININNYINVSLWIKK